MRFQEIIEHTLEIDHEAPFMVQQYRPIRSFGEMATLDKAGDIVAGFWAGRQWNVGIHLRALTAD